MEASEEGLEEDKGENCAGFSQSRITEDCMIATWSSHEEGALGDQSKQKWASKNQIQNRHNVFFC